MVPDVELNLRNILANVSFVSDLLAPDGRVFTEWPQTKPDRAIRVRRLGGSPRGRPGHIDRALVQIDVYAGSKTATFELARAVATVLIHYSLPATDGVISDIAVASVIDSPDPDFEPPRPRYVLTATVTQHL